MHPLYRKEKEPAQTSQHIPLAIAAGMAIISLTIALVPQNYVDDRGIKILLVIIALILILGFFGPFMYHTLRNHINTRRYNKLAKSHFKKFKVVVSRFEVLTENRMDNIQVVISDIKQMNDFSQIDTINSIFIQNYYSYYKKGLNQFGGTKDSLIALAREFENILDMYDAVYIKGPVKSIKNIGCDKVPLQYKNSYDQARVKYINFINDYRNFARDANADFKDEEMSKAFGNGFIIREWFEIPEKL